MTIQTFAVLKDYFDKEFSLAEHVNDVAGLRTRLAQLNPAAKEVLDICRFAVHDEFVDNTYQLTENDTICVIPPSSGG